MDGILFEVGLGLFEKIVIVVVVLILSAISKALVDLSQSNKDNAKVQWLSEMLLNASEIVKKSVIMTNKKFVDELKSKGSFDKEDMKRAFEQSIVLTKEQMTPEVEEAIKSVYGDVDRYIDFEIEKQVEEIKSNKKRF